MTVTLYTCYDDKRKINKTLSPVSSFGATATKPCSILNPELILSGDSTINAINANYAYVSTFGRYYFIDDYTIDSAGRIHIQLSVDPLYTYRSAILSNAQLVTRSESIGKPTMITDSKYPVMPYKNMQVILFEGSSLNLTNAGYSSYNFVLNVAGGGSGQQT